MEDITQSQRGESSAKRSHRRSDFSFGPDLDPQEVQDRHQRRFKQGKRLLQFGVDDDNDNGVLVGDPLHALLDLVTPGTAGLINAGWLRRILPRLPAKNKKTKLDLVELPACQSRRVTADTEARSFYLHCRHARPSEAFCLNSARRMNTFRGKLCPLVVVRFAQPAVVAHEFMMPWAWSSVAGDAELYGPGPRRRCGDCSL